MMKLDDEEMKKISGGSISASAWALIAGIVSFLGGLLDGYTRPFRCR